MSSTLSRIALVINREYITRVRKKSFILVTIIVPLSLFLLIGLQFLITKASEETTRIAVKNETSWLKLANKSKIEFEEFSDSLAVLKTKYAAKGFDGVLYIPELATDNPSGIIYISDNLLGFQKKVLIENQIESAVRQQRFVETGINKNVVDALQKVNISITEQGDTKTSVGNTGIATGVGMAVGILMYMTLLIYGAMVMRGVMEEKNSRIVELILSSVKPFELMMGKIVGIGLVGITQFGIWLLLVVVAQLGFSLYMGGDLLPSGPPTGSDLSNLQQQIPGQQNQISGEGLMIIQGITDNLSELPLFSIIFAFIFFFVTGYLIYAALYAGLSSAINDEGDIQQLTFPVTVPVILSFFILMASVENPNNGLATWASMFPLTAPIIMPARIAFGVPVWQIIVSMSMMLLGVWFFVWLAGKIYRTGILMYGKKITLREIIRWI
ncbi:MAG: ABC transporter permease [Sphingobacteriales bacterium]|jgi:ABC-2 type transport system permease protein|nr:ABC transporter permease [Sphingobacteriales bacterium]MBP9140894.1 ABC transporter permease [Chitinophagales bacterium]MDA0197572.1 ABC transporter permease [Bacteroidota bacterium]MBK6889157.1 ABC transporter permease [Sphingobacteriales bacterium]MBK7528338.1 ABC transporter permease [Sphingobacteriales bacterium]